MHEPRGVALVSGASGGIGEAICRALHDDGWTLVIGYVSENRARELARKLESPERPVRLTQLDLTRPREAAAAVDRLLDEIGRVDALVLNAGATVTAPLVKTTEAEWWQQVCVNFLGPVAVTHRCLPAMIEAGAGVIVAVTSEAARVGDASHSIYSASKAALTSFLKTIVREYGRRGITANCVAPGPISTPFLHDGFSSPEHGERAIARLKSLVPLHRLGEPEEVAAAIRFLVSDAPYVAGQQLGVGGGVVMS